MEASIELHAASEYDLDLTNVTTDDAYFRHRYSVTIYDSITKRLVVKLVSDRPIEIPEDITREEMERAFLVMAEASYQQYLGDSYGKVNFDRGCRGLDPIDVPAAQQWHGVS